MDQHEFVVDRCLFFCAFFLAIVLPVLLRYTDSDYPFGICKLFILLNAIHYIGDVMVSVLASSAVDRGFEPRSGQTKDYKLGICCFSVKHAAFRRKSKGDWLARNQDNVSEWGDMRSADCYFSELVLYKTN